MENYKIRVNSEAESIEAQELFFELGYKFNAVANTRFPAMCIVHDYGYGTVSTTATDMNPDYHKDYKKITLPQLRDIAVLHRNDVNDATHDSRTSVVKGFLSSDGVEYIWNYSNFSWDEFSFETTDLQPIHNLKEQGLISGADALRALADGKEVLIQYLGNTRWFDVPDDETLDELRSSSNKFRLKPKTITLNGIEIPAPFEPKEDDRVWVIDSHRACGYGPLFFNSAEPKYTQFGAWRTEEEIKSVLEALRGALKNA